MSKSSPWIKRKRYKANAVEMCLDHHAANAANRSDLTLAIIIAPVRYSVSPTSSKSAHQLRQDNMKKLESYLHHLNPRLQILRHLRRPPPTLHPLPLKSPPSADAGVSRPEEPLLIGRAGFEVGAETPLSLLLYSMLARSGM